MKVAFRWSDYKNDKQAWSELVFDMGEKAPLPQTGEVVRLQWPQDGDVAACSGTVKEVFWTVTVRVNLPRKISTVIILG